MSKTMRADSEPLGEDRFVMSFYGARRSSSAAENTFHSLCGWFVQLGFSPDRIGITGTGHTGKIGDYRRGIARLEKTGFADVDSFEINVSLPLAKDGGVDYSASAVFSRDARDGGYVVAAVPSSYARKGVWLPIVRDLVDFLHPSYGIAFEMPLRKGPIFYALGLNSTRLNEYKAPTDEEYDRRLSISRWGDLGMVEEVYRQGFLRNVYRWNFLTQPQLDRPVEGASLAKWIKADPHRGTLEPLAGDVWLWEVEESNRELIRDRLHDADAIFDWRKYWNIEPHIKTVLG